MPKNSDQYLIVPQGSFLLHRYPVRTNEQFRAWDAADEYVLSELDGQIDENSQSRILVVNDGFGAISLALASRTQAGTATMMTDSRLARQGLIHNLDNNHLDANKVNIVTSLEQLTGEFDFVIIKIPKTLALLEDQLFRVRSCLTPLTRIIAAGMTKQIHRSTLKLFERIIGPTHTSLARKKARLVFSEFDVSLTPGVSPYPKYYILDDSNIHLLNHANVFSQGGMDLGTRFFIEHIPSSDRSLDIVDLGCGNGLLGIIAAKRNPNASLLFCDESYMAVASARANFNAVFQYHHGAEFNVTDCLSGIPSESADLILNNPPFHVQNAITDHVARQMFKDSYRVLRQYGVLLVIGNRHLGYRQCLKRMFGHTSLVAENSKFVIIKAVKHIKAMPE